MRTITDMAGRKIQLPESINRVYAPSPYASTLLYSLCPKKVCGCFSPLEEKQKKYLHKSLHDLPVIGRITEIEAIRQLNPELIVIWGEKAFPIHEKSEVALAKLGIPYIYACAGELVDLRDYPEIYRFLGKVLDCEKRAELLAQHCKAALEEVENLVNAVHPQKRPRVYYAEGKEGMETEFSHSLHAHLLQLIGDVNVHRGVLQGHAGMEKLSQEEILSYDPEVIIVWQEEAKKAILNPKSFWKNISAVKNNRVHMIPNAPYSYFDRPPSFMRILGLKWLLKICYPDLYKKDLEKETQDFFNLFL